ncbi:MAG TPA: Gfo/Idh/MocA family oxidoreductase [Acidimicrobiales bacterium]|nr:Gfo/Idh/MocA family oxidoreductase [Acidimicrobiales bacterium]
MAGREPPYRVALLGYGVAGRVFHAPLIAADPHLELAAVVTTDPARRDQSANEHPGARVLDGPEAVWERAADFDLCIVATPNRTHKALALASLGAGLATVVDKPVTGTAAEAMELAELAKARGLLFSVYQNRRWDGDFLTVCRLLDEGRLGDVWRYESRFERWRPEPSKRWRESGNPEDLGGVLYDLGSHLVDQAIVVLGPVRSVFAEVLVRRPGAGADDDSFLALEHTNGARSHLWASATAAQLGPRFRVLGSRAGYVKFGMDPQEDALKAGSRPGPGWGKEPQEAWGWLGSGVPMLGGVGARVPTAPGDYPAFYRGIVAALRGEAPPPVTGEEAAGVIRVLEAAKLSAQEGRTVYLSEVEP